MTRTLPVRNPRTGSPDFELEVTTGPELERIGSELRRAQTVWAASPVDHRIDALRRWGELIGQDEALRAALVEDTGRVKETDLEIRGVVATIERWCREAPARLTHPSPRPSAVPHVEIHQRLQPHALVGVISPWNFPLLLSTIDAIPALLAGCAVVVKPSEIAPRFARPLAALAERAGLGEVLRIVGGDGETGEAIVDRVDFLCFTGSVATGRRVAQRAARRLIPASMELGGKDAAIVTEGADLDRAAAAILWGALVNAGQSCLSIERVYVDAAVHDRFVEKLVGGAKAIRLAHPGLGDGHLGPIIAEAQAEIIASHLSDARARGARTLSGGEPCVLGGGTYCPATVLTRVDHGMRIMREETFGPIVPVMAYEGLEEAIRLATDTDFGLSGALFAAPAEMDRALDVAAEMRAGAISINDAGLTAMVHDADKTAFGCSGVGASRMGGEGMGRFLRKQALLVSQRDDPDPRWTFG